MQEWDSVYFPEIRRKRFEMWNAEWLKCVEADQRGENYGSPTLSSSVFSSSGQAFLSPHAAHTASSAPTFIDEGNTFYPPGAESNTMMPAQELFEVCVAFSLPSRNPPPPCVSLTTTVSGHDAGV